MHIQNKGINNEYNIPGDGNRDVEDIGDFPSKAFVIRDSNFDSDDDSDGGKDDSSHDDDDNNNQDDYDDANDDDDDDG